MLQYFFVLNQCFVWYFFDFLRSRGVQDSAEEKNAFEKIIDFVAGVFQPVIPALSGAGMVKAPFDAKKAALFPTNHAIGLVSDSGAEVMIHVGIDTVQLEGKYFKASTTQESRVKAGDILIQFDIEAIRAADYKTQTMVVVTNSYDYAKIETASHEDPDDSGNIITLIK